VRIDIDGGDRMTIDQTDPRILAALFIALGAGCGSQASGAPPSAGSASTPGPGCNPRHVAQAHTGGGGLVSPQPANAPVSCASSTEQASVDPSMVVLPDGGGLLVAPAGPTALLRSSDQGATWAPPVNPPGAPTSAPNHPWLWQDAQSHRLFYNLFFGISGTGACADGSGALLWTSDDEGHTWQSAPVGCGSQDYGQILTGPAATAGDKASLVANAYPNVVYYCATGPTIILGPDRFCFRSVDGGKTFVRTRGNPGSDPSNVNRFPHNGAVAADGTLYIAHTSSQGVALAISKDDGDSWTDAIVPGSTFGDFGLPFTNSETYLSSSVALDAAGNLYVVWVDSTSLLPYLAVSRDAAQTWSNPVVFGAPGVVVASYPNIVAKEAGHIAVAYYGSLQKTGSGGDGYTVSDGRPYNAYLMVSTDAFSSAPVFWTATVNDPTTPVIMGMSYLAGEYIGNPAFSGDSVWAAFSDRGKALTANLGSAPAGP
jgi:photosystem II stability/assembly factor-like uncharacterized protein